MTPTPSPNASRRSAPRFQRTRELMTTSWTHPRQLAQEYSSPVTPLPDNGEAAPGSAMNQISIGDDVHSNDSQGDGDMNSDGEGVEGDEDEGLDDNEGGDEEDEDDEAGIEEIPMDIDVPFDPAALGLKEIGNLASWTVSSYKPGCGVQALRDDDTSLFWQSDGPQPHHLNIHFARFVGIRSIRIFLDFEADESYTPTRITLLGGTGYHDLIPFAALEFTQPKGWIDVPLDKVGGGEDGKTLRVFLVQVRIVENHQNGKDTHVRGLKIYAKDERARGEIEVAAAESSNVGGKSQKFQKSQKGKSVSAIEELLSDMGHGWLDEPDWMGEPMIR